MGQLGRAVCFIKLDHVSQRPRTVFQGALAEITIQVRFQLEEQDNYFRGSELRDRRDIDWINHGRTRVLDRVEHSHRPRRQGARAGQGKKGSRHHVPRLVYDV